MANLSQMRDRVLDGVKRPGLTDTTEIDRLINQTYRELIARTRTLRVTGTVVLVSGQSTYENFALWTTFSDIRSITLSDSNGVSNRVLERISLQELLLRQQADPTTATVSSYAYDGLYNVIFYGAPQAATSTVTVDYVTRPSEMVVDADVPVGIPLEFHDTIVLGAISKAVRIWNPQYSRLYHEAWMQSLREYRQWLNRTGGAWMAKAVVKGTRSNSLPHDNSTYFSGMR